MGGRAKDVGTSSSVRAEVDIKEAEGEGGRRLRGRRAARVYMYKIDERPPTTRRERTRPGPVRKSKKGKTLDALRMDACIS